MLERTICVFMRWSVIAHPLDAYEAASGILDTA